jgi:type I restriction enzyme S subunit
MAEWKIVQIKSFLKERESRIKPEEANKMGLKRLNKIDFSGEIHLVNKPTNTDMILIKSGDLVISGINVEKGAVAVYQGKEDILATIHYSAYIFDETKIDIEYFKTFLKSKAFRDVINFQIRSGIKTELKASKFLPLEINLPDLETQEEIRNKINSSSGEISELLTIDNKNENYIVKLRQQILQEAVQGRLVKQDPKDEPASELLKKIKAEKDKLIKEGKVRKEKPLKPISEDEIPYQLPKGWGWVRLGSILTLGRGASPRPIDHYTTESNTGVPWIRIGDTDDSKYVYKTRQKITLEGAKKSVRVTKGDLIMSNSMSFGKPYVLGIDGCIHDGWLYLSFNKKLLNTDYLYYLLLSQQVYYEQKASGTGVRNLNINRVAEMPISLPPLAEQKRIVEKVDKLMTYCDNLEKQVKENQGNSEKLMLAVLKESFEK